ncbi:MAG: twin-arginine translocase subunit TatC [Rickettsiales bacterium]|nr:twin-arginine translocase subunit TatC [Rickettsiales bacterium]
MTQNKEQNLLSHFCELRNRIILTLVFFIIVFGVSYNYVDQIYDILLNPLDEALDKSTPRRIIFTGLAEAFMTYIKLAFMSSLFICFPLFLIQIYLFLAPGLYKNEKHFIKYIFFFSPLLFYGGAFFVYNFIFPLAWKFFLGFESVGTEGLPILLEARISEYLAISSSLIIVFGLTAQIPLLIILLIKSGVISYEGFAKKRKYVVIIIVSLAAIITPPDVISQIGLAIPAYLLFEISLLICRKSEKKQDA